MSPYSQQLWAARIKVMFSIFSQHMPAIPSVCDTLAVTVVMIVIIWGCCGHAPSSYLYGNFDMMTCTIRQWASDVKPFGGLSTLVDNGIDSTAGPVEQHWLNWETLPTESFQQQFLEQSKIVNKTLGISESRRRSKYKRVGMTLGDRRESCGLNNQHKRYLSSQKEGVSEGTLPSFLKSLR